jgi:indolepyruvate ferredoxin oxidoreductase beta subunit
MAQRGGAVFSTTRFGDEVYSPVVTRGEAQFLLSFEKLEALRYLDYLAPDGIALVNDQEMMPTLQALKNAPYPKDFSDRFDAAGRRCYVVPALNMALEAGNPKLVNTVMLGALSVFVSIRESAWKQAVAQLVPPKTVDLNLRVFDDGRSFMEQAVGETDAVTS